METSACPQPLLCLIRQPVPLSFSTANISDSHPIFIPVHRMLSCEQVGASLELCSAHGLTCADVSQWFALLPFPFSFICPSLFFHFYILWSCSACWAGMLLVIQPGCRILTQSLYNKNDISEHTVVHYTSLISLNEEVHISTATICWKMEALPSH